MSTPLPTLRKRLASDGYLFIKGLLQKDSVMSVRSQYFESFRPTGMLAPDSAAEQGIFNSNEEPRKFTGIGGDVSKEYKEFREIMKGCHILPTYLSLIKEERLRQTVRDLMNWNKEVLLERTMLRHNVPNGSSTGLHYDKLFLREGIDPFLTAWIPIGDCSASGGGLIFLQNSISIGQDLESEFTRRAKDADFSEKERIDAFNRHMMHGGTIAHDGAEFGKEHGDRMWLVNDYEAGDVVFFDEFLVHTAGRNDDEGGRIRLSTDLRFVEEKGRYDNRYVLISFHDMGGRRYCC